MRYINADMSISVSTAGHTDPAKDYAGLRAALIRWETTNGLRDADGFLKTSHFNRRNKTTLLRSRTRASNQGKADMQSGAAISAAPPSMFPLTLTMSSSNMAIVTEINGSREFTMTLPDWLKQR
jgi:hypothetical protein